jgi:hypothetical protein
MGKRVTAAQFEVVLQHLLGGLDVHETHRTG